MARNKSTYYLPPLLFSATLSISAGLLFWIQPLIGKTLLPLLGGAPAVWNTCLLFFQSMLLLGYVYALASTRWLSLRAQATVHVFLVLLTAIYLFRSPVHTPVLTALQQQSPTLWLLETLLFSVGLPFFTISASSPLLQSWFSRLRHHRAVDPYFLFSASNAGSLIALVAFPLALEPSLGLSQQHQLWRLGFIVLVVLTCVIALSLSVFSAQSPRALRLGGGSSVPDTHRRDAENAEGMQRIFKSGHYQSSVIQGDPNNELTILRRLRWLALSFVPSSLMLGVTTYITADVAAVPLLWVIPLALYLVTFVLAFSKKQFASPASLNRPMLVGALVVTLILSSGATEPAWVLILANLAFFFVAALMCHMQLANDRPATTYLAEYYLWIAVGGALGSVFNVLIAPVMFSSILEYPLAIVIACTLQRGDAPQGRDNSKHNYLDVISPGGLYVLTVSVALLVLYLRPGSSTIKLFIVLGIPLIIINHFFRERPLRFALGLGAVMLASVYYTGATDRTLHVVRNFFGTTRVATDSMGGINSLYSGNTVHGRQFVDQTRRCEPLSYHHENGPLGQVMAVFNAAPANHRVAVIGLGVGAMVSYSKPDQQWTFYEIDPDIISLARNSQYFTYLQNCASGSVGVVEGDARLNLQNAPEGNYGLIVLDAFSSDAIPVHLVTQQAIELYLSKLAEGGILAFHISNRSLNLKPILGDLAESKKLICIGFDDLKPGSFEGKDPSQWVVMARSSPEISNLSINSQWERLNGRKGTRVWSDDFSNILRAIRW
ncbi:MAG TPA: fused MFS/spermidine synthase [Pyrinomonadaceae bacterium]|jgi:Spermidine synthase|nr:fused MFS/spermidine synthase [Pyrinomonadaceae bacterium]